MPPPIRCIARVRNDLCHVTAGPLERRIIWPWRSALAQGQLGLEPLQVLLLLFLRDKLTHKLKHILHLITTCLLRLYSRGCQKPGLSPRGWSLQWQCQCMFHLQLQPQPPSLVIRNGDSCLFIALFVYVTSVLRPLISEFLAPFAKELLVNIPHCKLAQCTGIQLEICVTAHRSAGWWTYVTCPGFYNRYRVGYVCLFL